MGANAEQRAESRLDAAAGQWSDAAALLDALPMAAAVIVAGGDGFAAEAVNSRWSQLDARRTGAGLLGAITESPAFAAGFEKPDEALTFPWREGDVLDARHYSVSMAPIVAAGDKPARILLTLADRTSEFQTENTMRIERASDPLTGLSNRFGFIEALEARFAEHGAEHFAVIAVDLLRFARVNECVGSLGGDELIMTVARRLISALRAHDLLGRTGANEFAMIVRLVDGPGDVLHVVQRIEAVLARPCRLSEFEIKVDCAIGGAFATDCDGDPERLMRHAQVALKQAKRSHRVEFHQPGMLAVSRRRFVLETELRRAIENDALDMAFQPLVNLATSRIAGFEALARWHHPDLGHVAPVDFIAVAEESGLIVPLGRWALDKALSTLTAWDAAAGRTLPLYVGVNLSAIQVARDDIAGLVGNALKYHGVSGYRLSVELTESAIVSDPDRAGRTLDALKAVDAMVAMDDFGTGFSNLASLQKLPIDTLKIDRSFVTGMLGDPDKVAIVRAVLGLAQALGMTTTAEGIETKELAQALAAMGCTTGQGWYFAAGLAADAALTFAMESLQPKAPR
jgi:diguanylate cyclase (GGDEF)-like protein